MQQKTVQLTLTETEAMVALQALREFRRQWGDTEPGHEPDEDPDEGEWNNAAPEAETPQPGMSQGALDNAVLLDRHGVPWNGELHASTKKMKNDGRWKSRQGADKAQVDAWHRQHAGNNRHAAQQTSAAQQQPQTPPLAPPQQQYAPLPQPNGAAAAPVDYGTFFSEFMRRHDAGWMTEARLQEMMGAAGAQDTNQLAVDDAARARAYAWMMQRAQ